MKKFAKTVIPLLVLSQISCNCSAIKIIVKIMEKNPCYLQETRTIQPSGIMVHSTAHPGLMAAAYFDLWNREDGREVGVHAFVDDEEVYQYLPWEKRAWHCGGAANNTHISIEMCEPRTMHYDEDWNVIDYDPSAPENIEYFSHALQNDVELCVMLCKKFGIDPQNIISHKEGFERGLASEHKDPDHWWNLHGLTMDGFRELVTRALAGEEVRYEFLEGLLMPGGDEE